MGGMLRIPRHLIIPIEGSPYIRPQPVMPPPILRPDTIFFPRILPENPPVPPEFVKPNPKPRPNPKLPPYGPPLPDWSKCEKPWDRTDPDDEEEERRKQKCLDDCEKDYDSMVSGCNGKTGPAKAR